VPEEPMVISMLYVEDNDDVRESIRLLLEGDGRQVVACANASAAMAELERQRFDVLVTDVSLRGMSGIELARALLARHPHHWIVLCSGYAFAGGLDTLGPNVRSLTKPFEIEELDALLLEIAASLRNASTA
jgi:CheY-like chemotaxis protein